MSNTVKTVYVVVGSEGMTPEIYDNEDVAYDRVCDIIREVGELLSWSDKDYDDAMSELQEARANSTADQVGLQGVDGCGYWRCPIY